MPRHAMQHPARRGDQAIAAFFLDARQTRQELIGDVLAQALLAKPSAFDVQRFSAHRCAAHASVGAERIRLEPVKAKPREGRIVNLA